MIRLVEVLMTVNMAPPDGGGEGGPLGSMWFPLIMIAFLFYFILYLPEKKRKAQREAQIKGMQRGDEIVTAGGIYGKVTAITDKTVTVEIAPNVRIKVGRQHVTPVAAEPAPSKAKEADGDGGKKKVKDDKEDQTEAESGKKKPSIWSRLRGDKYGRRDDN